MFRYEYSTLRLNLVKANQTNLDNHFSQIYELYANAEIMQYSGFGNIKSHQELRNLFNLYFQRDNFYIWLLFLKENGAYIGDISLSTDPMHAFASISCFLNKAYWKKGYMTEAMKELLFSFFVEFGYHRVEAQIHIDNTQSIHFFEQFGFRYEGTLRQNFLLDGTFYDSRLYSMLFDEYMNRYVKI